MNFKTTLAIFCGVSLIVLLSAALVGRQAQKDRNEKARTRTFEVYGTVRAIDSTNKTLRIAHEEIPGYMPAMAMPFPVKDLTLLQKVAPGDRVRFDLTVTRDDSWIARIEKIGTESSSAEASTSPAPIATELEGESIKPGEQVPDFALTDQNGRAMHLRDFRGKVVLLTFIYTRCPLPNFCPLMTKNFAELQRRLTKEFPGKYQLLSVSIDPEFDKPEVLKDYAARCGADPKCWTFATGDADSIRFVAQMMGLYYAPENGLISHDLRTALIGVDGKLVHTWKSNVWTPYELQRRVREVLTGSADVALK